MKALLAAARALFARRAGGHGGGPLAPPDDDAITTYVGELRNVHDDGQAMRAYPPSWPLGQP